MGTQTENKGFGQSTCLCSVHLADKSGQQALSIVRRIQDFITENLYTCSDKILSGLGKMYSGGGDFTKNIDEYGGEGTAEFVDKAIQIYCEKNEEVE